MLSFAGANTAHIQTDRILWLRTSSVLLGFPKMEPTVSTAVVLNPGYVEESPRPYPRQSDLIALGLGLGIIFLYYLLNQLD